MGSDTVILDATNSTVLGLADFLSKTVSTAWVKAVRAYRSIFQYEARRDPQST